MTENQKLREAFEARMTDNGKWPRAVEQGRNGCYLLAQTENAWAEWQACAEALATPEPAVNQQLTTDPFDEREAFESEMRSRHGWNNSYFTQSNDGGYLSNRATHAYIGWQARAAMAQVSDINVVESFTNDTKDALMAGRAYAQEALIRFDDAYDRHPSTEPERNAILADIQLIDAALREKESGK